jgi:hypothetical protein
MKKERSNRWGTADLWAGSPHAGCSSVTAPFGGCSLLAPRLQPKSLAAPSAPIDEMASSEFMEKRMERGWLMGPTIRVWTRWVALGRVASLLFYKFFCAHPRRRPGQSRSPRARSHLINTHGGDEVGKASRHEHEKRELKQVGNGRSLGRRLCFSSGAAPLRGLLPEGHHPSLRRASSPNLWPRHPRLLMRWLLRPGTCLAWSRLTGWRRFRMFGNTVA